MSMSWVANVKSDKNLSHDSQHLAHLSKEKQSTAEES